MSAPAVSVLMTAFNRERYVAEAIESVLGQTLEDFELVVVDDASHDRTVDIARKYEADPRVRVVVNERNLGDYPNRNRAAALARGEFIKFHDSDDVMYPHCLAAMVEPLRAEPGAALALSSGWHWPGGPCPMLLTPRLAYQREFLGQGLFMCGPAGALIRTDVFRSLGGFPERGAASDYVFWLKACASVGVLLVPADLFWYRIHPGQEIQNPVAAREYALVPGEAWRALGAPSCPLSSAEREQARKNLVYTVAKQTLQRWKDTPEYAQLRDEQALEVQREIAREHEDLAIQAAGVTRKLLAQSHHVLRPWQMLPAERRAARDLGEGIRRPQQACPCGGLGARPHEHHRRLRGEAEEPAVPKGHAGLQHRLDVRHGPGDFAGHECFAAPRTFVVEEDAVARSQPVALAVIHRRPIREHFGHAVGTARPERRRFCLRHLLNFAEHFAARCLVKL